MIDNTVTPPVQLAGAPITLTDDPGGVTVPGGVTIPPVSTAAPNFFVYITSPGFGDIENYDDSTAPAPDGTTPTIKLTASSTPYQVRAIPVPH